MYGHYSLGCGASRSKMYGLLLRFLAILVLARMCIYVDLLFLSVAVASLRSESLPAVNLLVVRGRL